MTKQQYGDNIANRHKPQPTIENFREKFQKFRDQHPIEKFDEAFLDIVHHAAYNGNKIPYELAEGLFYYRFLRIEFKLFVWVTDYSLISLQSIAQRIGDLIDFDFQSFDVTIGGLFHSAIQQGQLEASQIANMAAVYQDLRSVLYMVSQLETQENE